MLKFEMLEWSGLQTNLELSPSLLGYLRQIRDLGVPFFSKS